MKTIFKYPLLVDDNQTVILPTGARVLSVAEQRGNIVLYALIDDEEKAQSVYTIRIRGTGHYAGELDPCRFLGTINQHDGQFMWHVFIDDPASY